MRVRVRVFVFIWEFKFLMILLIFLFILRNLVFPACHLYLFCFPYFAILFFWASSTVLMNIIVESYFYVKKEWRWKKAELKGYTLLKFFSSHIYIIAFIWMITFFFFINILPAVKSGQKFGCTFTWWIFLTSNFSFFLMHFLARFVISRGKHTVSGRITDMPIF